MNDRMGAGGFRVAAAALLALLLTGSGRASELELRLGFQQETSEGSGRYHRLHRDESWPAEQTALILCDVWDSHHSGRAVERLEEIVPRLEAVTQAARQAGVTIIHAPSDCMASYADHPARQRAKQVPRAPSLPEEIGRWCYQIPAEEAVEYPIDQSDGGEDDTPEEKARWVAELKRQGRVPERPWQAQHAGITIDADRDFISDSGEEVWSILESRGIENVIVGGVHVNMCVLGRPFGLRQMVRNGKNAVLLSDLTDSMYNPQQPPHVSHFTGTDLIVAHIERHVCPTITSDQFVGGQPFRFSGDTRPHLVMLIGEDEYLTEETLPALARQHLGHDFRVSTVFGSDTQRHEFPGMEVLDEADLVVVSIRRRLLPQADMQRLRQYVAQGKPMIGIRTASHAFSLRGAEPPDGMADWPEFDAEVWGGNYSGHHGNDLVSMIHRAEGASGHSILKGLPEEPFRQGGSLYLTRPLAESAEALLIGHAEGVDPEPVAWTFTRADGGRSFYTSLGHVKDFEGEAFPQLMKSALRWAAQGDR